MYPFSFNPDISLETLSLLRPKKFEKYSLLAKHPSSLSRLSISTIRNFSVQLSSLSSQTFLGIQIPLNALSICYPPMFNFFIVSWFNLIPLT